MIIRDGENGILVPVRDVDKLAAAMDKILSDAAYAGEIGNQAKQDIRASMHAEHVFSQWEEYISHILGKGTAGSVCGG